MIANFGIRIADLTDDSRRNEAANKRLGLRVIRLVESLPNTRTAEVIGKQLLRCGTSVGANYRAACRARSRPDFIAKLGIVQEEEADEIVYWIEMLTDCGLVKQDRVNRCSMRRTKLFRWSFHQYERRAQMAFAIVQANPQSEFRNPQSAI